ncbi:MAG: signal peptidase I [Burkholderiaceae bacterium]|jgi:signal peptidase I|nr:signal peptidase I [Burkholderiaceae bacterium]
MNFALILFVLTVVTGVLWVFDKLVLEKQRRARAVRLLADFDQRNAAALARKEPIVEQERRTLEEGAVRQPAWLEYTASFFPVILLVFLLRSFLFEPFRIPSGSMIPTLEIGDLILVNKYEYGIRLPVVNKKVVDLGQPKRGDVMVFRFPLNPSQDYIKRVVGLPGDRVEYVNKQLTINGKLVPLKKSEPYYDPDRMQYYTQFVEGLGNVEHRIIVSDQIPPGLGGGFPNTHPGACQYSGSGVVCQVPPGHYFMMGDNRDNSEDSRFWGFVPDENIVGRAFFIWMNFGNIGRIGSFN